MGPKRDVLGELAAAAASKVCISASPPTAPRIGGSTKGRRRSILT
jgi:hypothetical protein